MYNYSAECGRIVNFHRTIYNYAQNKSCSDKDCMECMYTDTYLCCLWFLENSFFLVEWSVRIELFKLCHFLRLEFVMTTHPLGSTRNNKSYYLSNSKPSPPTQWDDGLNTVLLECFASIKHNYANFDH